MGAAMSRLWEAGSRRLAVVIASSVVGWGCQVSVSREDGGAADGSASEEASQADEAGQDDGGQDAALEAGTDAAVPADSGASVGLDTGIPGDSGGDDADGAAALADAGLDSGALDDAGPVDAGLTDGQLGADAAALVTVSPTSLGFQVSCGTTPAPPLNSSFTVTNTSAAAITWTASATSTTSGADLSAYPTTSTLDPGASVTVAVTFSFAGPYPPSRTLNGSILITTDPPGSPTTVPVGESFYGMFLPPLSDVDFGDVPVGTSQSMDVGVNLSDVFVNGSCSGPTLVYPSGAPQGPFTLNTTFNTGTITFLPTEQGTVSATLGYRSSCQFCTPSTFTVTGTGTGGTVCTNSASGLPNSTNGTPCAVNASGVTDATCVSGTCFQCAGIGDGTVCDGTGSGSSNGQCRTGQCVVCLNMPDATQCGGTGTNTAICFGGACTSQLATTLTLPASTTAAVLTGSLANVTDELTADTPANLMASIGWGDGSTSAGTLTGGSGSFEVTGTHSYAAAGAVTVVVTVSDPSTGSTVTTSGVVNIMGPLVTSLDVGASNPADVTTGPDGDVWFVDPNANVVGFVTTTGAVTSFSIPTSGSSPERIVRGPDGNLWFTEILGNKVGRITTVGNITEFTVPTASSSPYGIAPGSDGNLWFTEIQGEQIGRVTTAGAFTEFAIPAPVSTAGLNCTGCEGPLDIASGSDGALWFTLQSNNLIGRVTTAGQITQFHIPSHATGTAIVAGPDGNLWFGESDGLGRITTAGTVTEFPLPTSGTTYGLVAGSDGNLWFGTSYLNRATTSGTITEFALPSPLELERGTVGGDGDIWFAASGASGGQFLRVVP
jgi:virginiamycin B lyase